MSIPAFVAGRGMRWGVPALAGALAAEGAKAQILPAERFAAGGTPRSLAAGDLEGDARPGVATGNGDSALSGPGSFSVLPGAGAASLGSPLFSSAPCAPFAIAAADLAADGRPDAAVAGDAKDAVLALRGDGAAGLEPAGFGCSPSALPLSSSAGLSPAIAA
jgi:hypothetical protein